MLYLLSLIPLLLTPAPCEMYPLLSLPFDTALDKVTSEALLFQLTPTSEGGSMGLSAQPFSSCIWWGGPFSPADCSHSETLASLGTISSCLSHPQPVLPNLFYLISILGYLWQLQLLRTLSLGLLSVFMIWE